MVVVSYSGKEINAKLVYYGPGLSGKTTNLEYIYQSVPSTNRGKMVSMKTRTERTLFFDFLPVDLGEMGGFKTRFLLYTVPGQVYYNATRKLVLRGVDAIIFVADSARGKMEENIESLQNLHDNLKEYGLSLDEIPLVMQYNKRDLPDVYTTEELEEALNPEGRPYFEAVATTGQGVFEAFRGIARLLLQKLSKEIKFKEGRVGAKAKPAPAASASAPPTPVAEEPNPLVPDLSAATGSPVPTPPVPKPVSSIQPPRPAPATGKPYRQPVPSRPAETPLAGPKAPAAPMAPTAPTPPTKNASRGAVSGPGPDTSVTTPPPALPPKPEEPSLEPARPASPLPTPPSTEEQISQGEEFAQRLKEDEQRDSSGYVGWEEEDEEEERPGFWSRLFGRGKKRKEELEDEEEDYTDLEDSEPVSPEPPVAEPAHRESTSVPRESAPARREEPATAAPVVPPPPAPPAPVEPLAPVAGEGSPADLEPKAPQEETPAAPGKPSVVQAEPSESPAVRKSPAPAARKSPAPVPQSPSAPRRRVKTPEPPADDTSPMIERRIQVPVTVSPGEIARGVRLRLVLEVQLGLERRGGEGREKDPKARVA